MIKLKKREKLALLKQIIAKYNQQEYVAIGMIVSNPEQAQYNSGWYNALQHVINEITAAGILDD